MEFFNSPARSVDPGAGDVKRETGSAKNGYDAHSRTGRGGVSDYSDNGNGWILKGRCDGFPYLGFISSSLNASVGVLHPGHVPDVPFKRSQIDFISRFESAATGAPPGR